MEPNGGFSLSVFLTLLVLTETRDSIGVVFAGFCLVVNTYGPFLSIQQLPRGRA